MPATSLRSQIAFDSMRRVDDLFDEWRTMGSKRLPNGTELIARVSDVEVEAWLHVLFPGIAAEVLDGLEKALRRELPRDLRTLYRVRGGMQLFGGAFRIYGCSRPYFADGPHGMQPDDIVTLNHQLDVLDWKDDSILAFAENALDLSVHAYGVDNDPSVITRVDRATGRILERHSNIWQFLAAKLYRLDELMLR